MKPPFFPLLPPPPLIITRYSVHDIIGLIKRWLSHLSTPIIPVEHRAWWKEVTRKQSVEGAKLLLSLLEANSYEFLQQLFETLAADTRQEGAGRLDAEGAGRCITGSMLADQTSTPEEAAAKEELARKTHVFLIENIQHIYNGPADSITVTAAELQEAAATATDVAAAATATGGGSAAAGPSSPEQETEAQRLFKARTKETTAIAVQNL